MARGRERKCEPRCPGASTCTQSFSVPITFDITFVSIWWGLSFPTTSWYHHHWNCIHRMTKEWFIGSRHLPKFWGKKPKATTKVTLTSHQLWCNKMEQEFYSNFPFWSEKHGCKINSCAQNFKSKSYHPQYHPQKLSSSISSSKVIIFNMTSLSSVCIDAQDWIPKVSFNQYPISTFMTSSHWLRPTSRITARCNWTFCETLMSMIGIYFFAGKQSTSF